MYPVSLSSFLSFCLVSYSKSGMELPNDVQVCFLLCIVVGMYHNAARYAADRMSFHKCGMFCASHASLQMHYHSY